MFYGPGAGSLPTATSVTGDIVAACRNLLLGVNGKRKHAPQYERKVKDDAQKYSRYFHRIRVKDEVGVLTHLTSIYSDNGASLATVIQQMDENNETDLIIITHEISRKQHLDILDTLKQTDSVLGLSSYYRVEGE